MIALLLACAGRPAVVDSRVEAAANPLMPAHGGEVVAARDALTFADLVGYRDRMQAFEGHLPEGSPDRFRGLVSAAAAANDLGTADLALGRVAIACGECHAAAHVAPKPRVPPVTDGDGVRAEMMRHDRALTLAWDGLVRPDDQDLYRAAEAFRTSFLAPLTGPPSATAAALDQAVTDTAARLARATDPGRRASEFGQLLGTCAACHTTRPGHITAEPE